MKQQGKGELLTDLSGVDVSLFRLGLPNFARSGRHSSPSLPGFERLGRRCRSRCPLQTPISAGPCEGRGARRPRASRCPGRTPGCARARRRHGTGSRRWKPSLRGFARPERCCRERSTAARASSRTNRARSVSAASSTARPVPRLFPRTLYGTTGASPSRIEASVSSVGMPRSMIQTRSERPYWRSIFSRKSASVVWSAVFPAITS